MFKTWKAKRRRKKAREKIKTAVYAFMYLNRALIYANVSRQVRRQLKHDLMTRDDPEEILQLFLKKIEGIADKKPATIGNDKGNRSDLPLNQRPVIAPKGQKVVRTGNLPRSSKGIFKTDKDTITTGALTPQENIESPSGNVFRAKES